MLFDFWSGKKLYFYSKFTRKKLYLNTTEKMLFTRDPFGEILTITNSFVILFPFFPSKIYWKKKWKKDQFFLFFVFSICAVEEKIVFQNTLLSSHELFQVDISRFVRRFWWIILSFSLMEKPWREKKWRRFFLFSGRYFVLYITFYFLREENVIQRIKCY